MDAPNVNAMRADPLAPPDAVNPPDDQRAGPGAFLARLLGSRRLQLAILFISLASYGLAFPLAFPKDSAAREGFLLLTAASLILEIAGHAIRRIAYFRVLHAVRLGCLVTLFLLLDHASPLPCVLLSFPYLAETALFDRQWIAVAWDAVAVAFLGVAALSPGFAAGMESGEALSFTAVYLLATAPAAGLAFVAVHHREENVRRSAEIRELSSTVRNLVDANMALQLYAHNIETESSEKERNRITRELHDMIGYALTNVIVMMNAAPVLLRDDPQALEELCGKICAQAEGALAETRSILRRLRDIKPFEPIGLRAIWHLTRGFQGATGVEVRLNLGNLPSSFGRKLDSVLFRLIQEGLTNAFRHGKATRVRINLWLTEGEILVSILDNGSVLAPAAKISEGIGLAGMRERLSEYGGQVKWRMAWDGFELLAEIPYGMGEIGDENQGSDSR
jgi:signal transduction histidine kinase